MDLGEEDQRVKVPFSSHNIKGKYQQHDVIIDAFLGHLAEVMLVSFLL
jgi:hypothetical protein